MDSAFPVRSVRFTTEAATRAGLASIEADGVPASVVAATALAALLHRYRGEREVSIGYAGTVSGILRVAVDRRLPVGELLLAVAAAVRAAEPAPRDEPVHGVVAESALLASRPEDGLVVHLTGDGFVLSTAEPNVDLDAVARHLVTVLHALVAELRAGGGEQAVASLPLLDEAERRLLLVGWNDTADPAPEGHFHDLVEGVARRDPDALAAIAGRTSLTFGELDGSANRLANHLATLGVTAGSRVGIGLDRSPESLVAQLAVFKLGAAAVLLDSSYPQQRLEFMLADSAAVALVTSATLADRFAARCPVVLYDGDAWRSAPAARPVVARGAVTDDSACHVAYTSGSTGVPKAVLLRHGPLRNTVHVLRGQCGIVAGDRGSWLCSPGFGLVEVDCFPLLAAGASVHIPDQEVLASPERLRDWLIDQRLTQSLVLTAMAERLWRLPWPSATPLKVMRIAGERARSWPPAALPFEVLNVYGSAEATVVATCDLKATAAALAKQQPDDRLGDRPDDRPSDRLGGRLPPIGRPVANVRTYVLDEDLQPVPPGVVGELYVSGASLSAGYLNRPDVEGAKFLPNPLPDDPYPVLYRSGDLARYWPDGTLEVVGRVDHEVKIRGYRVHLGEVESVLAGLPGVRQCAVLAREDGGRELRLVGYVEPAPGDRPSVSSLRRAMERALPAYMTPSAYVVGDLPTTPNGKIDRVALPDPPRTRPDLDAPYVEPVGASQRLLAGLFEQALEVDGIGALDSFFELGGDSLRAMRLLDRLRNDHGVAVGMAQLYGAPTVAELSALIAAPEQHSAEQSTAEHSTAEHSTAEHSTAEHSTAGQDGAGGEPFPLTAAQRALLAAGGDAAYYFEWDRDWLDVDRFRLAWRQALARHDALRTVLTPDHRQRVLPPPADRDDDRDDDRVDDHVIVIDLSNLTVDEATTRLAAIRSEALSRVADPTVWPLHELRLTTLPDQQVRIHLALHGLTVDAASARLLFGELADGYEHPNRLQPAPARTFAEYARAATPRSVGGPPIAPAADAGPLTRTAAATHTEHLEPALWAGMIERAAGAGVTPGLVLVATFASVLGAATGHERFTIGMRTFDRPPGYERTVGAFAGVRSVEVTTASSITQSAHDLGRRIAAGPAAVDAGVPALPVLVGNVVDLHLEADQPSLGEPIIRHSRYPGVLVELEAGRVDGRVYLDLYGQESSLLGQLNELARDHLRLIDWLASDKTAYRNLEEERGCGPESPCR